MSDNNLTHHHPTKRIAFGHDKIGTLLWATFSQTSDERSARIKIYDGKGEDAKRVYKKEVDKERFLCDPVGMKTLKWTAHLLYIWELYFPLSEETKGAPADIEESVPKMDESRVEEQNQKNLKRKGREDDIDDAGQLKGLTESALPDSSYDAQVPEALHSTGSAKEKHMPKKRKRSIMGGDSDEAEKPQELAKSVPNNNPLRKSSPFRRSALYWRHGKPPLVTWV
jgi:hypothetical protein